MQRLINVSNRLPIQYAGGNIRKSSGGLASALEAVRRERELLWIGWPGSVDLSGPARQEFSARLEREFQCVPVYLTEQQIAGYYTGYSNSSLWPLLHYFSSDAEYTGEWFDEYRAVNLLFANAVIERADPEDAIWIHDYHLMLAPHFIRQQRPELKIGFFLHTPFPSYEVFRCHPNRRELLEGLLGANLVGFHTFGYLRHFRSAVLRILGIESEIAEIPQATHRTRIGVFPIGIHWQQFRETLESEEFDEIRARYRKSLDGKKLVLSVERLDYTKGIPRKLAAIETFLRRNPGVRDQVRFLLVAVPSRESVERYRVLVEEVEQTVGSLNGEFSSLQNIPIHFIHNSISLPELCALYSIADVALVTPLIDGMNLVAKEYVACQRNSNGVLILSEFAGAAQELFEALLVNPYDIDEVAEAIRDALLLDEASRPWRTHRMRQRVLEQNAVEWAKGFLHELEVPPVAVVRPRLELLHDGVLEQFARADGEKALFLDYDGTLVEIVRNPEEAVPTPRLTKICERLSQCARVNVYIVSGRTTEFLDHHLGRFPFHLIAEHGYRTRTFGEPWRLLNPDVDLSWKDEIERIMSLYGRSTPGSRVEVKASSLVWHYRIADPEFGEWKAGELFSELTGATANLPIEIKRGKKIVEVTSQQISKGVVLRHEMHRHQYSTALCAGDDQTDESMFTEDLPGLVSIKIGAEDTNARYRCKSPEAFLAFLERLIALELREYALARDRLSLEGGEASLPG